VKEEETHLVCSGEGSYT